MRFILSAVGAFAAVVAFSAMGSGESVVQAAPVTFELQARGAEEVPPVSSSTGSAFGRFTFDEATRELTFAITISGLSPDQIIGAHFHRGARGTNGPIIYRFADSAFTQVSGKLTIAEADVAELKAGGFYWNNHSKEHPGGFARAQVIIPSAAPAAAAPATTAPVTPPRTGDAGLSDESASTTPVLGLVILSLTGLSVFALARKRA